MWHQHYSFILNKDNRAELWPLYLAYDTAIRQRCTQESVDPSQFHIALWNDLEVRYLTNKVTKDIYNELGLRPSNALNVQTRPMTNSNTLRYQPYGNRFRDLPHRASNSRFPTREYQNPAIPRKTTRCMFCGDTSNTHFSRNCTATTRTNGMPCHLQKQSPNDLRCDRYGKTYCFSWNGRSGCKYGANCKQGEHQCSLCGSKTHAAQSCAAA